MEMQKKRSGRFAVPAAAFVLMAGLGVSLAAPPTLVRYQARLTDMSGTPLTGIHSIRFSMFPTSSGDLAAWTEGPLSVDLGSGSLDVLLGQVTPFTSSLPAFSDLWLEVKVDGAVLTPRQRLTSVPYAHVADRLGTKTLAQVEAGVDADVLAHAADADAHREHALLEESAEIDADIAVHAAEPDPHAVYVKKAGDTMTGTLTLSPSAGNALVTTGGNVGLGTTNPLAALTVNENIPNQTPAVPGITVGNTTGFRNAFIALGSDASRDISMAWLDNPGYGEVRVDGLHPLVLQRFGGNVGIQTTAPQTALEISKGSIYLNATTPSNFGAIWFQAQHLGTVSIHHMFLMAEPDIAREESISIFHQNSQPQDNPGTDPGGRAFRFQWNGQAYGTAWNTTGLDVAETYPAFDPTLSPGDVVALDSGGGMFLVAATRSYEPGLLGVVSEDPGVLLGGSGSNLADPDGLKLALSGRVPVRVTVENGPIRPGDYLTSSSVPGRAMRATRSGRVIGIALEALGDDPDEVVRDPAAEGKILVFLNPHSWVRPDEFAVLQAALSRQEARLARQHARLEQLARTVQGLVRACAPTE